MIFLRTAALFILATFSFASAAADYPGTKGRRLYRAGLQIPHREVLQEMRLHYMTIGKPDGIPVVVLHGTGSSGQSMLTPAFAGELFGPADDERNPPETGIAEAAMKPSGTENCF
jgi:homoserine O-acetyltransferase